MKKEINKNTMIEKFKKHVEEYNMEDGAISKKYYHSLRVMNFAEKIALSENFSDNDCDIAVIIGLLHDYSRFEQWKKYHTYSDVKSIDHGDLAVERLFKDGEIKAYYEGEDKEVIKNAIQYHNKKEIPLKLDEQNKKMCKLIRDADKLDIFNIYVSDILKLKDDGSRPTKEVEQDFLSNKLVNYKDMKNSSDRILQTMALFYDLNYKFSIEYVKENNILEKLFDKINNKQMYEKYYKHIKEYLGNR